MLELIKEKEIRPGWIRKKRDSLLSPGTTEVAFIYAHKEGAPFVVVADHTGFMFRGDSPKFTQEGAGKTEDFAWIMAEAGREYLKLKRARLVVAPS